MVDEGIDKGWKSANDQAAIASPLNSSSLSDSILGRLPAAAKSWFEHLSWQERRYVLSLCHLMCAASAEVQAEFLDEYTADGLVSRKLEDRDTKQRVAEHLGRFRVSTELTEPVLRCYIRQFYIHSAQDTRRQPDLYLKSALRLVFSTEERNNVFNYVLGFELLKMMFCMSWLQHERLYRLQHNQEEFISSYIKPIQHAHSLNGIIVPRDKSVFFAKRDYFVKVPEIPPRKLIELVMATFTTDKTSHFGFTLIRHPNSFGFDYDFVFGEEPEAIFF
ncbi:MAG: cobyrinic acid a,c-diamide synthase [Elainellaceae cyanobacterium]